MSKTVGYIRVSSKDQCLERQIAVLQALGIEEKYIYQDKQSGKDFDRTGYQYMKKCLNLAACFQFLWLGCGRLTIHWTER